MPVKGKLWRHVTISTYCSWLKGDPRGFRTRDHTIHSSGDYKKPPPKGEHDGLHDYFLTRARREVQVNWNDRTIIGQALVKWFREHGHPLLALAVTKVHTHFLVELVDNIPEIHRIVGEAKRKSSRAVKATMPGKVWSRGGQFKPVKTREHQKSVFGYVLYDQGPGAWTWSFKDRLDEGVYGRCRPALRSGRPWKKR